MRDAERIEASRFWCSTAFGETAQYNGEAVDDIAFCFPSKIRCSDGGAHPRFPLLPVCFIRLRKFGFAIWPANRWVSIFPRLPSCGLPDREIIPNLPLFLGATVDGCGKQAVVVLF